MANFMRSLNWWELRPAPELLVEQPGEARPHAFVAVSASADGKTIVAYLPGPAPLKLFNLNHYPYEARWFDPVSNKTVKGKAVTSGGLLRISPPAGKNDLVLVLTRKN